MRQIKIRSKKLPWITPELRILINQRYKVLKKAQSTGDQVIWTQYRHLRNRVTTELRQEKAAYFSNKFGEIKSTKAYWDLIKKSIGTVNTNKIGPLRDDTGNLIYDDKSKAVLMNDYFANIGENLASSLPISNSVINIQRVTPVVTEIDVDEKLITKLISNLNPRKSTGPDGISSKLLRLAGKSITGSFGSVCEATISSCKVPAKWKIARLQTVYKKNDASSRSNYRPLSILSMPSKIVEKLVDQTLTNHIEPLRLSSPYQWGYKKGHSTELLLLNLTEIWRKNIDAGMVVGLVNLDFMKAFDSVSHEILLTKLQSIGVSGNVWLWLKDYLSQRSQFAVINGKASDNVIVKYGVPQGSILGPKLFSIFVNDLPECTLKDDKGRIYMYADDTNAYCIGPSVDIVVSQLNQVLQKINIYCIDNKLTLHPEKWEAMLFYRGKSMQPFSPVRIGNHIIPFVPKTDLLGLTIDNRLSWSDQIEKTVKSYGKKLSLLKHMRFLPKNVLNDYYWKVVIPSVTYGQLIWSSGNESHLQHVEACHARAARIIYNQAWDTPSNVALQTAKWQPLHYLYTRKLATFVYKCLHGLIMPEDLKNFYKVPAASSYNTRQNDLLPIIRPNTNWGRKAIAYRGTMLWNALTENTRNITNLNSFKLGLTNEKEKLITFSFAQGVSFNHNKSKDYFYF